jgi:hypothetical protein
MAALQQFNTEGFMADFTGNQLFDLSPYFSTAQVAVQANLVNSISIQTTTSQPTIRYRGRLGGNYVYSDNTPPGGATDVVIFSISS